MFRPYCPLSYMIELGVIAFAYDRIYRSELYTVSSASLRHNAHNSILDYPYVQGIRERNGAFKATELVYLYKACGFTETVQHIRCRGHFVKENIVFTRKNYRYACFMVRLVYGNVPYANARYIANRIPWAGLHSTYGNIIIPYSFNSILPQSYV